MLPSAFARLRLAPGFLVNLDVLEDSDFDGQFRVSEEGNLALPEIGNVPVGGLTVAEARNLIVEKLVQNQLLKRPQVNLNIVQYTAPEVSVLGEVINPGQYNLFEPTRLVDVLAMAGGTTLAAGDEVVITPANRKLPQRVVHYSRGSNPEKVAGVIISAGDSVEVMRAGIVYVMGEVNRPGGYLMQESGSLTLLQAISLANGTAPTAKTKKINILRRQTDGSMVYLSVPYNEIQHGRRGDVHLQAADVVYVPSDSIKSIYANSKSIMASAATAAVYGVILY
jgi:polysaccharide export outer membrane protein